MVNKNYAKGYRFERRVMKDLIAQGFVVFRQGKSAFPDLFAFNTKEVWMVECKYGKSPYLSKAEREGFRILKFKTCARMFVAKAKPRQKIIYEEL